MKVGIIFGTSDKNLIAAIGIAKFSFIPEDIKNLISRKGHQLSFVGHVDFNEHQHSGRICNELWKSLDFCDGIIFMCCLNSKHLVYSLGDALFIYHCELPSEKSNYVNHLRAILTKSVRRFAEFANRFQDMKHRKLLLLPFEYFESTELRQIRAVGLAPAKSLDFSGELHRHLATLSKRQRPKRLGNYPDRYIVDDQGRHFAYGHELHGPPDTATPPHSSICDLNAEIRFGMRYDRERHYNVSVDGKDMRIAGTFTDCHGATVTGGPSTHLNIYPNGFLKNQTGAA
jgi:hypothetical protein